MLEMSRLNPIDLLNCLFYSCLLGSNIWGLASMVVCLSLLAWSSWYIWSFKISPWFHPFDAPPYPYAIPGHAYDYFQDSHEFVAKARLYFSESRRPFAIVLAGVRHYVVTSPADAHLIYSRPLEFSFDFFLSKALSGFGVNQSSLDAFWQKRPQSQTNPSGKCLVHVTEDIHKRHLLPGVELRNLINKHKSALNFYLSFEQLACRCGLSSDVQTDPIPLYTLCTATMTDSMQACLFDPIITSIDPGMTKDMMEFTDDLWKLMHPTYFVDSTKPVSTLKRYHNALKKYQKLPGYMRSKESPLLADLICQYGEYDIDEDDIAAVLVMVYWATVANTAKLPYWMIANILCDENLCASIRNEILPAMQGEQVDSSYLAHQCPTLKSVYLETLRLTKADHSYRRLEGDMEMGGTILRKGGIVMLSITELHRDGQVFGSNASDFDATRFLAQPNLSRSKSFRPFGSGSTYCPGREFAFQESLVFVALMLHRYDVQILDALKRPKIDQRLLTVGLSRPLLGSDLHVSLRPRHLSVDAQ